MRPSRRNPASLAAGRAPNTFYLVAERSEDTQTASHFQGSFVGIDPGVSAGLAVLTRDVKLIEVFDTQTPRDCSTGRASIKPPLFSERLLRWLTREVFCEFVRRRTTDTKFAALTFELNKGAIEIACGAPFLPMTMLKGASWQRAGGIPAGASKDQTRGEAVRRCPDRPEAALIAVAGLIPEGRR
jgi:hypothetical protein